ncbi:hypothetical protein R5R35_008943 [Gryllus longicercus]|uniref:17S U2 SnRNP complex component HTATSF1 n=1 Tax=Gryllus longicercus TaxID=2509291 RepID=A0AAN9Z6I3_9ORTH
MSEKTEEDLNQKDSQVVNDSESEDKFEKSTAECNDVPNTLDSSDPNQEHNKNVHYEGETCIYTDPESKYQYVWNSEKNEWVPRSDSTEKGEKISEADSNSLPNTVSDKDYKFDGESYVYVDKQTGVTYKYDTASNKWIEKTNSTISKKKKEGSVESDSDEDSSPDNVVRQDMSGHYSFDGDSHLYTDPSDGTVYLWDREKNAWFPKVDEDFLAHYQMNYGFTEAKDVPESKEKEKQKEEKEDESSANEEELKRKAAPKEPAWFDMDDQFNTKVYVSNLPLDITEEEFVALMQKCGLVMRDVETGKMKVKLYTEPGTTHLKGDALCTYIKVESVELALKLLDGSDLRGKKLKVERAKFQMKGEFNPNLKPRKRRKKDKEKLKKIQEKLLDWRPDKLRGERSKHERVVIVKNLFDPAIFEKEVALILEYQQDLREECSKCGDVKKVIIYDRNPDGVAQITFREPEEADECIKLLNGRWFGQRKISAETWDGKTKYKIVETEEEKQKRLQGWNKFLEDEKEKKEALERAKEIAEHTSAPVEASEKQSAGEQQTPQTNEEH